MAAFGDAVIEGGDDDVLGRTPVQGCKGEQRAIQAHLPSRAESDLNVCRGLGAQ